MDFYFSVYDEIIGENSYSLRYSDWNNFLTKYIYPFFDLNEINTLNFNNDDYGSISSYKMKLLNNHLCSIQIVDEEEDRIKNWLYHNNDGIKYS